MFRDCRTPLLLVLLGPALVACASWSGDRPVLTPRSATFERPCVTLDGAKLRAALRHGPVSASYYLAQRVPLSAEEKQWLEERTTHFGYRRFRQYPRKDGGVDLSFGPQEADDPAGIDIHWFTSRKALRNAEAAAAEIRSICQAPLSSLSLTSAVFTVERDQDEASRQINENIARSDAHWAALRRRLAREEQREAERAERERLRQPPTVAEMDALLRPDWPARAHLFDLEDTQFGRMHKVLCKRRRSAFVCTVGVTATSKQGPEYAEIELEAERDDKGNWMIYRVQPDIIIIS